MWRFRPPLMWRRMWLGRDSPGCRSTTWISWRSIWASIPASIGVLTVPRSVANRSPGRLVASGVKGIWNFTNIELTVDAPDIVIENVHFADSLLALSYMISEVP